MIHPFFIFDLPDDVIPQTFVLRPVIPEIAPNLAAGDH